MHPIARHAARFLALAFLAALVPACGMNSNANSGGNSTSNSAPSGSQGTVLADDFSTGFPGTNWVVSSTGKGMATIDPKDGNPAPSVQMTGSGMSDSVQAVGTTPVLRAPFTAKMELAVFASGEGSGGFDILDSTSTPIAAMEWHPIAKGAAVTFMLALHSGAGGTAGTTGGTSGTTATTGGTAGTAGSTGGSAGATGSTTGRPGTSTTTPQFFSVAAPIPGSTFHPFELTVDATQTANWTMDGGGVLFSQPNFPPGPYMVRFYSHILAPTGPFTTFVFDNVKVTSP